MGLNVYDPRREVWVVPFTNSNVKYGFLTNVLAATSTDCGHTAVAAPAPAGLVFGANAPKPGRATKQDTTGSTGSYYSIGNRAALKTAGYSTTRPKIRRGAAGAFSTAVFVTIGGIKYAWRMPTRLFTRVTADLSALGVELATSADRDLVWGAQNPQPPRAYKKDGTDILSTYVDPTKVDDLPPGWSTSAGEEVD